MSAKKIFLSPETLRDLRTAYSRQSPAVLSLTFDIGLSRTQVRFRPPSELHMGKQILAIPRKILESQDIRTIYKLDGSEWIKWQRFDPIKDRYYKMVYVAPDKPPTIEISGIKMHITKDGDPQQDTLNKLGCLKRLEGSILDSCMGLGYTAIAAATLPLVEKVHTCEVDTNVLALASENPWSDRLFHNRKICTVMAWVQDFVRWVPDNYYHGVIHDPPRFSLAPELYGVAFYDQIFRILNKGGEFYHYTGDPGGKTRKQSLLLKTSGLLNQIGFRNVQAAYAGVTARK